VDIPTYLTYVGWEQFGHCHPEGLGDSFEIVQVDRLLA